MVLSGTRRRDCGCYSFGRGHRVVWSSMSLSDSAARASRSGPAFERLKMLGARPTVAASIFSCPCVVLPLFSPTSPGQTAFDGAGVDARERLSVVLRLFAASAPRSRRLPWRARFATPRQRGREGREALSAVTVARLARGPGRLRANVHMLPAPRVGTSDTIEDCS